MDISCAFPPAPDTPEHVALAERLGYRRSWVYDPPALQLDVWATLARAAERTHHIGLGPGVLIPSLRHVLVSAAAVATLAALAPGRVVVGGGSGVHGGRPGAGGAGVCGSGAGAACWPAPRPWRRWWRSPPGGSSSGSARASRGGSRWASARTPGASWRSTPASSARCSPARRSRWTARSRGCSTAPARRRPGRFACRSCSASAAPRAPAGRAASAEARRAAGRRRVAGGARGPAAARAPPAHPRGAPHVRERARPRGHHGRGHPRLHVHGRGGGAPRGAPRAFRARRDRDRLPAGRPRRPARAHRLRADGGALRRRPRVRYQGTVYRPPSEAGSLIVQATLGCPHNRCAFCGMYKGRPFRVRPLAEVVEDLDLAREAYGAHGVRTIFLADGNTAVLPTATLVAIGGAAGAGSPDLERITMYGSAKFLVKKRLDEWRAIAAAGITRIHSGLESGGAATLAPIGKGGAPGGAGLAHRHVVRAGIELSVYLMVGLAGVEGRRGHALGRAAAVQVGRASGGGRG